ncbi:MAG TPA: hypothetical protein VL693_20300 [Vicinamibacterales bacterium]|jgi:hypothetical protein|nr:hypothetical protein [Vicinamibacterales bacterium]
MTAVTEGDVAGAQARWDAWRARYADSSRRSLRRSVIVVCLLFAVIITILVTQLLERYA